MNIASKIFLTFFVIIQPLHSQLPYKQFHIFGYPLNSPIGIGPCPLTADAHNITHMARNGFDVITYKTIRTAAHATHAQPCVFKVDCQPITLDDWAMVRQFSYAQPITLDCFNSSASTSLVNSYGIGSRDAQETVQDIRASKNALTKGQVLIVSVHGSGKNKDDLIADFVEAAKIAVAGGADIVELNVSCPNVNNNLRFIYQDASLVYDICRAVCSEFVHIPCTIKVGLFQNIQQMKDVLCAAHAAGVRGVCGINTVPLRVLNYDGQPLFGKGRDIAGLSGAALFDVTKEFVKQAREIIDEHNLELTLFALGGIMQQEQFDELLVAGADIVQCVTGALCNRDLAFAYHDAHKCYDVSSEKVALIKELFAIGAIQIKDTLLKSGMASPIYFDMRVIISHPKLLQQVATFFNTMLHSDTYDVVCGVPYGAVPLATTIAMQGDYPLVMQRKEIKNYGMQKMIEGDYKEGARCAVIEDVISTGGSILETVRILEQNGLVVNDVFVIIDREQKGKENVQKQGYKLYSLFTITEILHVLLAESFITHKQYARIKHYCAQCTVAA